MSKHKWRAVVQLKKPVRGKRTLTVFAASCRVATRRAQAKKLAKNRKSFKVYAPGAKRAVKKCPIERRGAGTVERARRGLRKALERNAAAAAWFEKQTGVKFDKPYATLTVDGKRVNLY